MLISPQSVVCVNLNCFYFCFDFRELSHLTHELSQAEKKINIVAQNDIISLKMVEVVILSKNSCHYVSCLACKNSYFLLSLR